MCLLAILEKCLFKSPVHFLSGLFGYFDIKLYELFVFLEMNLLSIASSGNIFLSFCRLSSFCLWFPLLCKSFYV